MLPSCLHWYTFLQCSLFLFFDEPSSQVSSVSQNSSSTSFSVSLTETIMVFFFLVKNSCRALHCHYAVATSFFFSFLFFCQKKFHRSSHCRKEIFAWNYSEHWCEFNIWQNVMVEASTMVIWCCESIMFLLFLIKIALTWTARTAHGSQNQAVGPRFVRVPAIFAWSSFWCLMDRNSKQFEVFPVGPYGPIRV